MNPLITSLKGKADATTQRKVAARLGISEGMLSMILSGRRIPGTRTLRAIVREYPDLWPKVSVFLVATLNDSPPPSSGR